MDFGGGLQLQLDSIGQELLWSRGAVLMQTSEVAKSYLLAASTTDSAFSAAAQIRGDSDDRLL